MNTPRWRRFEANDFFFAYDNEHVYVGLELPTIDELRASVARMASLNPEIFRVTDLASGRWRPFDQPELASAPERLVVRSETRDPESALHEIAATPLGDVNFRLVLGEDWLGLRVCHAALFDGVSSATMMSGLLGTDGPAKVRVIPGPCRDTMLARYLGTRPEAVRAAIAHKRRLGVAEYGRPRAVPDEPPVLTHASSPSGMLEELRHLRDSRWAGASVASAVLVGLRAALAQVGPAPRQGVEMLFDVRRFFPSDRALFGNWASGVHLEPADDLSPVAVSQATRAALHSSLPVAAMAASRLRGRRLGAAALTPALPAPHGAPRLSFSFMGAHSPIRMLPWRRDRRPALMERSRPANAEAMTIMAKEIHGHLSLNVSHYGSVWPRSAVETALQLFLDDPAGVIATASVPASRKAS